MFGCPKNKFKLRKKIKNLLFQFTTCHKHKKHKHFPGLYNFTLAETNHLPYTLLSSNVLLLLTGKNG